MVANHTWVPDLLRQQGFRRFWTAQTVSFFGDQVSLLALPLTAVLAVDATTAEVGYLSTAAAVPMLLFGLHAGGWVDRIRRPRRRLLLVSADLFRVVLVASIPISFVLGWLSMVQLLAVAALAGTAAVVFNVGAASIVPALVPPEQRVHGNSLLRGSFSFSWVAGPGVGGLLVQVLTAPFALLFDAISFLASAALMRTVTIPESESASESEPESASAAEEDAKPGAAAGLRFITRHPVLRPSVVCGALLSLCYTVYFTLLIPFAVRELHLGSAQIGLALAGGAVGALTGSVMTARITRRFGVGPTLILGSIVYVAALLAIPLAPRHDPWVACATIAAAEFVSGFGLMLDDINSVSVQQSVTPENMLGRVSGASMALGYGARAVGGLAAAASGTWLGLAPTIAFSAALGVASVSILVVSPIRTLTQLPSQAALTDESS